jgi:hypothetical protein
MEFKDRVANKPNRVKLTYENDGSSVYATVELADEPIKEGTPLNAFNMNKLLNKENNDYIVEQGTSGIWTYRKWASGIAECWGMFNYSAVLHSNWVVTVVNCDCNFPIVFTGAPTATGVLSDIRAWNHWLLHINLDQEKILQFALLGYTGDERNVSGIVNFHIKGKWK